LDRIARFVALLSILLAVSALAETSHVLVPIAIASAPLHGAFGSIWTTELVARNDSESVVEVGPLRPCFIPEGCGTLRAPHSTFRPGGNAADPNAGLFLAVGLPEAIRSSCAFRTFRGKGRHAAPQFRLFGIKTFSHRR